MRGFTALLMLLTGAAPSVTTQVPPAPPPAATLAIGNADTRMTIPVTIAGAGPYAFVIDTGAERTVISRELARTLGLPAGRGVRVTAMTGTSLVDTVRIPSLVVSSIASNAIEAPTLLTVNLGAAGLLGIDTLADHALSIDLDSNRVTLRNASRRLRPNSVHGEVIVRARSIFGQLIVTNAAYRGHRIKVVIDTGSSVSIGNEALRTLMRHDLKQVQPIVLTSVTGAKMTADYVQVPQVDVGGISFANLPIAFAEAAPFRRFGLTRTPALLLGMDALRIFRHVDVDFPNREIRFLPPADAKQRVPTTIL